METTSVTMNLRTAIQYDFFDMHNKPKWGALYFTKSVITGEFDRQPYYFNEDTDKADFKTWFKNKQIYVPVRLLDEVIIN